MAKSTKIHNFLAFLTNNNVVVIHNSDEMAHFVAVLRRHGFESILYSTPAHKDGCESYDDQLKIVRMNADRLKLKWDGNTLYFEKQRVYDVLGCYAYTQDVEDWYGQKPFSVDEIDDKEDD